MKISNSEPSPAGGIVTGKGFTMATLTKETEQALQKIKDWKGNYGMPIEYIDWMTANRLTVTGLIKQVSPGPGWGLYLVAV